MQTKTCKLVLTAEKLDFTPPNTIRTCHEETRFLKSGCQFLIPVNGPRKLKQASQFPTSTLRNSSLHAEFHCSMSLGNKNQDFQGMHRLKSENNSDV